MNYFNLSFPTGHNQTHAEFCCGRMPAALRMTAGRAIRPRPETERVICMPSLYRKAENLQKAVHWTLSWAGLFPFGVNKLRERAELWGAASAVRFRTRGFANVQGPGVLGRTRRGLLLIFASSGPLPGERLRFPERAAVLVEGSHAIGRETAFNRSV